MSEKVNTNETASVESDYDTLASPDYERPEELRQYMSDAERNLMAMSRTARGVVDTSASVEKAQSMTGVSGEEAADLAKQNFDSAIEAAYENRNHQFESPIELRAFVEALAKQVNAGIVRDDSLIRSSDSQKYPYVRVANLEKEMGKFYEGLYERLKDPEHDPVEAAAYAEFCIDFAGHFFADGCGKTAKVVSSYVLMRSGHKLPEYKGGREAYYANQLKQIAGEDEQADEEGYQKFLGYYRTLFED